MTTKAQRFRERMAEKGFVQGNEWVPSNQREHFRTIAKALREGQTVTIGHTHNTSPEDLIKAGLADLSARMASGEIGEYDFATIVSSIMTQALEMHLDTDWVQSTRVSLGHEFWPDDIEDWLAPIKVRVDSAEAAPDGPRKYNTFAGCVNDYGQVHVDGHQIGIVDTKAGRWKAIYDKEVIDTGHVPKLSKTLGAYMVARAVLEHFA